MREMIKKLSRHSFVVMAFIAGAGWVLDAGVYYTIAHHTGHIFLANILGNCCGIVFSFTFGVRHAFAYRGAFLYKQFLLYALFAFTMMPVFSGLIVLLVNNGLLGLLGAKIAVTVPSFLANYYFLRWLTLTRNGTHD